MPVFEYVCKSCSRQFEQLVRHGDHPACPDCGGEELEKLFSVFAAAVGGSRSGPAPGPCGTCGDPRGPGACSMN
ncbi:MAG: zinc ribbon domain-containing protein [Acidobacteria bacterium]|nr:zinc ribbon domain-containing protein [Acidobacteriota bacterium]MBI3262336.1 zinc ribbon domain-containing protein [Acidobacteriota bacterium]